MNFRNTYLPNGIELSKNIEANNEVSDIENFAFELDFIEKYQDLDDIIHIKTIFNHNDIDENELWEIFSSKDVSSPLELLLNE